MLEFISQLYQLSLDLHPVYYLTLVIFISILENLFPPVPGDTFLVYVTYVFIVNEYSILNLFIQSVLASIGGFMLIYGIGKHWGRQYFYQKNFHWMPLTFLKKVEDKFQKYGLWVILFNRFMPGMRSVIGLFSGISNIKWKNALLLVSISTLIWNGLLVFMGYYLGENWQRIEKLLNDYNKSVAMFFIIILTVWFTRRYINFKNIRKGT